MPESTKEQIKMFGPAIWKTKKRPVVTDRSTQEERQKQVQFDMAFSGATSSNHWEDEWPTMLEVEFDKALMRVLKLELGGHYPDGTHPRASKAE